MTGAQKISKLVISGKGKGNRGRKREGGKKRVKGRTGKRKPYKSTPTTVITLMMFIPSLIPIFLKFIFTQCLSSYLR